MNKTTYAYQVPIGRIFQTPSGARYRVLAHGASGTRVEPIESVLRTITQRYDAHGVRLDQPKVVTIQDRASPTVISNMTEVASVEAVEGVKENGL
jgi:hypothetical protein